MLKEGVMSTVVKDERVLLVVANLSDAGDPRFQLLYQWLDANALGLAWVLMRTHYRQIEALTGSDVTSVAFVDRIQELALDPRTRVLDVFLVLHGSEGALHFDDGVISSRDLKTRLQAMNLKHRLRLLYSTACYGATHAEDFVEAGFRVASGAKGINANGPVDYPVQLHEWGRNRRYKAVVNAGNQRLGIWTHDAMARALGFDDVNSEKIIKGKNYTSITSEAV
jgi:hypothetical protein